MAYAGETVFAQFSKVIDTKFFHRAFDNPCMM
jgi:hypothetical protein